MYDKVEQQLAPNSTMGGYGYADAGSDSSKLAKQDMPNTRVHGYISNKFADTPHELKGKKGK